MSKKGGIDYDPDAVSGDDGEGFYQSDGDNGELYNSDELSGGDLCVGDGSEEGSGGDYGFADDTPEDTLNGKWRDVKELKGEEKLKALIELVKEEKVLMADAEDGTATNTGFKTIKHIILLSVQLGKNEDIIKWFKRWVDEYKVHMRAHLQAVPKLLNKILDYPELASLVTLSFKILLIN
jgi:hypothetical protein